MRGQNSLAFGFNTTANGDNAVAIGANSSAGADNTVSVGSSSLKRKIVNMGNGDINNVSSDAINGSQLYAISKSVSDRLGGYHDDPDNVINSDGTLKAPTYYLQSGQYNNVGEASRASTITRCTGTAKVINTVPAILSLMQMAQLKAPRRKTSLPTSLMARFQPPVPTPLTVRSCII